MMNATSGVVENVTELKQLLDFDRRLSVRLISEEFKSLLSNRSNYHRKKFDIEESVGEVFPKNFY